MLCWTACRISSTLLITLGLICVSSIDLRQQGIKQSWAQQSRSQEALAQLKLKLERNPQDLRLIKQIALILYKQGQYQESLSYADQLILSDDTALYLAGLSLKGKIYLTKLKQYEKAKETYILYIKKVKNPPKVNKAYYALGITLDVLGDPQGALQAFETFIDFDNPPKYAKLVQRARSIIKRLKGSTVVGVDSPVLTEEKGSLDSSLKPSNPTMFTPKKKPVKPLSIEQDFQPTPPSSPQTVKDQSPPQVLGKVKPIKLDQEDLGSLINQGDQAFGKKKYKKAYTAYLQALNSLTANQELHYKTTLSAFLSQNYQQAQSLAEEGLITYPQSLELLRLLHLSHAHQSKTARPDYSDVRLALKEGRFETVLYLSALLIKESQSKDRSSLHLMRARALHKLHRYQEAIAEFKTASLYYKSPILYYEWGKATEQAKRLKEAQTLYQKALMLLASSPQSPLNLQVHNALQRLN